MGSETGINNEVTYIKTDNILEDAKNIIESAQKFAYSAINFAITQRNWFWGKRISEEDFHGEKRAEYGKQIIKKLSKELSELYDKGFDASNLYKYTEFYQTFPNLDTLRLNSLSWSHYLQVLRVADMTACSADWRSCRSGEPYYGAVPDCQYDNGMYECHRRCGCYGDRCTP